MCVEQNLRKYNGWKLYKFGKKCKLRVSKCSADTKADSAKEIYSNVHYKQTAEN